MIVIVEDDAYLRDELICTFEKAGYEASGITDFEKAEEEILKAGADLVVLDINLPGRSGYELCKSLKGKEGVPILVLTARDTLSDELTALGLGADDFLAKPCHTDRLLARARRLLQTYDQLKGILQAGPLFLDTETYKITYKGQHRILPETEGKIMEILMKQFPEVVSKSRLISGVWGPGEFVDENILQVNMSRLRKNLTEIGAGDRIRNIRGLGYVIEADDI